MKRAIYPGSFDPITLGHLDIIRRASRLFDEVIVCVMVNSEKNPLFTMEDKVNMIQRATQEISNVFVDTHEGLMVDYAKDKGITTIVKGLRSAIDLENEHAMASINVKLWSDVETVVLLAKEEHRFISSSAVRQLLTLDSDFSFFIHHTTNEYIKNKFKGV